MVISLRPEAEAVKQLLARGPLTMLAEAQAQQVAELLHRHPAFSLLEENALAVCSRRFEGMSFAVGDTIEYAGEPSDFGYLVGRGKVRAVKQDRSGRGASLGTFYPGDWFAAASAKPGRGQPVACRAAEDVSLFRLPCTAFADLVRQQPLLRHFFDKPLGQQALLRAVRLHGVLTAVPAELVPVVLAQVQEETAPAGTVLAREGETADRLYVIRAGTVQVRKWLDGQERILTELGEGAYFGERALLLGEPRDATVVAMTDLDCFTLDRERFDSLANQVPELKAYLARRLHHYLLREERIRQATDIVLVRISRAALQNLLNEQPALARFCDRFLEQGRLLQLLRLSRFLAALPPAQVLAVLKELQECSFAAGTPLLRAGQAVDRLYIVRAGAVRMARREGTALTLGPGDAVGEAWFAGNRPADAEVIALTETACFFLDRAAWDRLATAAPDMRLLPTQPLAAVVEPAPRDRRQPAGERASIPLPKAARAAPRRHGLPRSFPWRAQQDANDCGVACLAMVVRSHGVRVRRHKLRSLVQLGLEGASLLSLGLAAGALGFRWQALRTDMTHLVEPDLPAIAHWLDCHYVVVYRVTRKTVLLADPALGLIKMSRAMFERNWDGRLLVLAPPSSPAGDPAEAT